MMEKTVLVKWILSCFLLCAGCKAVQNEKMPNTVLQKPLFDKQGHRGCRGLMPENTIPAMIHAVQMGVNTLELDVVVTADSQLLVSHEPYFHSNITTRPDGSPVTPAEEKSLNIFKMTYAETEGYDVGLKPHPGFPQQQKMAVHKPLLADLIDSVEQYIRDKNLPPVFYNIETKSSPFTDGQYHPAPPAYVDRVVKMILDKKIEGKSNVQSFDFRILQYLKQRYPSIKTGALIDGSDKRTPEEHIAALGFTPDSYSPHYSLVTPSLVAACRQHRMRLVPWTVNDKATIDKLKAMGVDGIITDYPNLF
jgi:glycerophosphoryl diester phosphodiesterase